MLRLRPFAALRPKPEYAARVAAVPYDVVDRQEAKALATDPLSFLHVSRAEIDLPEEVDAYDDRVYRGAAEALARMQESGVLVREDRPRLYAYRQQATLWGAAVSQVGIVGCCHIDDYARGLIKKHEVTRAAKEDDRTRHTIEIAANAGPVFLTHRPHAELAQLTAAATTMDALYDFEASDGVRHTLWRIDDDAPFVRAYAQLPCAYVADGHHRSASAARAGAELRAKDPAPSDDAEYNWFMCALFDAAQLNVLPYHRVVRDLGGRSPAQVLEQLRAVAHVQDGDASLPREAGSFGLYLEGRWYQVQLPADSIGDDPLRSLDYVLLTARVLGPILGIDDLRTDPRIDFVGGIRGTQELQRRVDSGSCALAFAMRATSVEQLMRVADAGQIMPPKSTWFEPKLRSGLLVHSLR